MQEMKTAINRAQFGTMIFWVGAFVLLFYGLGFRSLWGSEDRWAEVVREMLLSGDFFHPQINGQPYFDKPLLTYWVIVPSTWIAGGLNELSVRLPSALAGIATLWGVYKLGIRLFGRDVALVGSIILATSWGFCFWSRTAAADAENMAVIVLAVCWYFGFRHRPGFGTFLGFYLICAVGAQFKGLTAIAVPLIVILPDILIQKSWKSYLSIANGSALAVALLIYLLPFVYASLTAKGYGENGLALAFRENLLRFFKAFDHKDPFYCYLYYVPFLFIPWIFWLIGAVVDRIRYFKDLDSNQRWLSLAVFGIFLLFTLSSSRRSYYILPILPFLALMTADFLLRPSNRVLRDRVMSPQFLLLSITGMIESLSPLLWPVVESKTGFVAPFGLKASALVAGVISLVCLYVGRRRILTEKFRPPLDRILPLLAAAFVLMGAFFCIQQNSLEIYRTQKPFLISLKKMIPGIPPEKIGISKNMAGVVFYLNMSRPVIDVEKPENLKKFLAQSGKKIIIARKRDAKKILAYLVPGSFKEILSAPDFSWSKRNDKGLVAWEVL